MKTNNPNLLPMSGVVQNQTESLGPPFWARSVCAAVLVSARTARLLVGEQHASYVLYGRLKGRRFAVYVPENLCRRYGVVWKTGVLCRICSTGRTALCQSFETERTKPRKKRRTEDAQVYEAADQFRRLGIAAAGHRVEPLLQNISDFLDDHEELIEPYDAICNAV